MVSKLSGGGEVVPFECEPRAAEEMRDTFSRNSHPIETVETFVSGHDEDGHRCLDTAAQRFFVLDFLKIDIEGAEGQALIGTSSIITARKPSIIVEVHGKDK